MNMINRNIARIGATLAVLGGWSQASLGASIRDIGASCFAQDTHDDNDTLSSRSCAAEAGIEFTREPGICSGQTIRTTSSATVLATITKIAPVQQSMCARANASVPVSY